MASSGHSRRALGRGLTNLIPQDSEEKGSDNNVVLVDANSIRPNPFQPRREFNQEELNGLAESIKSQGLLQPIVLRKKVDGYEIVSGERRFRALRRLGHDKIPCIVKPKIADREMIEMALVENIQREDLNEIEQAVSFQRLMLECGLSHDELSRKVGKSRSAITNTLRLLKLPEELQQKLVQGEISMGHGRALLSIDSVSWQKALGERIVSENLSVREVEEIVQHGRVKSAFSKTAGTKKRMPAHQDPDLAAVVEKLQHRFGTRISVVKLRNHKGKIEIHFQDMNDFNRIAELLS
jgi:ParB family transcriptional regulator, chromosome partitioning protein